RDASGFLGTTPVDACLRSQRSSVDAAAVWGEELGVVHDDAVEQSIELPRPRAWCIGYESPQALTKKADAGDRHEPADPLIPVASGISSPFGMSRGEVLEIALRDPQGHPLLSSALDGA